MRKPLLLVALSLLGWGNAMAFDKNDIMSYANYAQRVVAGNEGNASVAALSAVADEADGAAGTPDESTVFANLKAALSAFYSTASGDNQLLLEFTDGLTGISMMTEAGWEFGATGGGGNNQWTMRSKELGRAGSQLAKWKSTDSDESNWAKETLYDLPAGSYVVQCYAVADENTAYFYYRLNDGEIVSTPVPSGVTQLKLQFYSNEPVSSLEIGVADFEGKVGWVEAAHFEVVYAGADALAPYKAALDEALTLATAKYNEINNVVPAGVSAALKVAIDGIASSYASVDAYETATSALNAATYEAVAAENAFGDFMTEYGSITDFLKTAEDGEAKTILETAVADLKQKVDGLSTSTELLEAYNALGEAYRSYQYAQASSDNPVVLFDAPAITSLSGWDVAASSESSTGGSKWYVSYQSNISAGGLEMWGSSAANYAYRTIANVPAGLYELSFYAAHSGEIEMRFHNESLVIAANESGAVTTKSFYLENPVELLKFGLYSADGNWVAFNQVQLVYKGDDAVAAIRYEYQQALKDAEEFVTTYDGLVPATIMADYADFVYEEEPEDYETVEALESAKATLSAKVADLEACKQAYADYQTLSETLSELDDRIQDGDLKDLLEKAKADVAKATSLADIEAQVDILTKAYRAYGLAYASKDNPFAVLNLDGISSFDGWVTGGESSSNNGSNNWYLSQRTSAPVGQVMEMWGSNKENYAYKKVADLPAGAYRVSVLAGASAPIALYFNENVYALETTPDGTEEVSYVFVLPAAQDTTLIGWQAPATWVAVQSLKVEYLGNEGVVDIAKEQLLDAINAAKDIISLRENVGEAIFLIKPSALDTYQQVVAKSEQTYADATTLDEVAAASKSLAEAKVAYQSDINIPDADTYYVFKQQSTSLYLYLDHETGAVTVAEQPMVVRFIALGDGTFEIVGTAGTSLGYKGTDSWSMSALVPEYDAWTVEPTESFYLLRGKNGYLATDDVAADSPVYGNKAADHENGKWLIEVATDEQNATGIQTLGAQSRQAEDAIYNLAGQRVGGDYKGFVIKGGKKFLQK